VTTGCANQLQLNSYGRPNQDDNSPRPITPKFKN
jgi:hypothetical protein